MTFQISHEKFADRGENLSSVNLECGNLQDDIENGNNYEEDQEEMQVSSYKEESFRDWKQSIEVEALQNEVNKRSEKTDGVTACSTCMYGAMYCSYCRNTKTFK